MKFLFALLFSVISLAASELQFPAHGLTLTLPDGKWVTEKEFDNPEPSISIRIYAEKEAGRQVQLMFGENSTPNKDLDGFSKGWIRGMTKSGVTIISEKKDVLDGIPAFFYEAEVRGTEKTRYALAIVALSGTKVYTFSFSSDTAKPSADPLLSAIMASIKIKK